MSRPSIRQILFDFDGVLAHYRHELRIAHLAQYAYAEHERVREALFTSGLETEYDGGLIDTGTYLSRLSNGVGAVIDIETWIGSRVAGSRADDTVLRHIQSLDAGLELGVLTNNGLLMAQAIPRIVAPMYPRLEGRVLCSGALRIRKPAPDIYRLALAQLGWNAAETLFVDDIFANVQGARSMGLHAETVTDGRSLGKVLRRYRLI